MYPESTTEKAKERQDLERRTPALKIVWIQKKCLSKHEHRSSRTTWKGTKLNYYSPRIAEPPVPPFQIFKLGAKWRTFNIGAKKIIIISPYKTVMLQQAAGSNSRKDYHSVIASKQTFGVPGLSQLVLKTPWWTISRLLTMELKGFDDKDISKYFYSSFFNRFNHNF